jgi:hypothetical protein
MTKHPGLDYVSVLMSQLRQSPLASPMEVPPPPDAQRTTMVMNVPPPDLQRRFNPVLEVPPPPDQQRSVGQLEVAFA